MLDDLKPTTLTGIKRLATRLKRSDGLPHQDALDEAARRSGFENLRHAQNMLADTGARPAEHRLHVTTRWKRNPSGDWGTETLVVDLSLPIAELIPVRAFAAHLEGATVPAADHLVCPNWWSNAEHARYSAARIARYLQFIDATGLWPTDAFVPVYRECAILPPEGERRERPPMSMSHDSCWRDPRTGRMLIANNPYLDRSEERRDRVNAWAARAGVDVVEMDKWSLHTLENDCRLQIISHRSNGVSITEVVRALTAGPAPIDPRTAEFISLPEEHFTSPAERAALRAMVHLVAPRGTHAASTDIPYETTTNKGLRPKGAMRMSSHYSISYNLRHAFAYLGGHAEAQAAIRTACAHLAMWAKAESPEFFRTAEDFQLYDPELPEEGGALAGEEPDRALDHLYRALAQIEDSYAQGQARDQVLTPMRRAEAMAKAWEV